MGNKFAGVGHFLKGFRFERIHEEGIFDITLVTSNLTRFFRCLARWQQKHVETCGRKKELLEIIHQYREAYIPLIVPITLINHYVQTYLNPHCGGVYIATKRDLTGKGGFQKDISNL